MGPANSWALRARAAVVAITLAGVMCGSASRTPARQQGSRRQPRSPPQLRFDRFGGLLPAMAPAARFFRLGRIGNRDVFVSPAGGAFWMLGVFDIQPPEARFDATRRELYPNLAAWGLATAQRLRRWGFNTAAEYSSAWVKPISRWGPRNTTAPLPFVSLLRPAFYSLTDRHHYAAGPVKNLVAGLDGEYHNYRGDPLPDVFDPNFAQYAKAQATRETTGALAASPWLIGTAIGDADDLWGFGPGGEVPTVPPGHASSNIGWIALCTDFRQTRNAALGVRYSDPRVYTKYALAAFLRRRYGAIGALDRAWGANYTSFGDAGGYGRGTGLLDEDGRHAWIGDDDIRLSTAHAAVRGDLEAFLSRFADRYFSVTAAAVRRARPGHLVFGPAALNGWRGLTRPRILAAADRYVDVIQASFSSARVYALSRQAAPDRPFVTWMGFTANAASALALYSRREDPGNYSTQAARGAAYARELQDDFARPRVAGAKLWAWGDSWAEKANWGLVSLTGQPYGDAGTGFIAWVRRANDSLIRRLGAALRDADAR